GNGGLSRCVVAKVPSRYTNRCLTGAGNDSPPGIVPTSSADISKILAVLATWSRRIPLSRSFWAWDYLGSNGFHLVTASHRLRLGTESGEYVWKIAGMARAPLHWTYLLRSLSLAGIVFHRPRV